MRLKDFGKGGRGSPALPYVLLAGIKSHRGDDDSGATAQGPEARLPQQRGRAARCDRTAGRKMNTCYATSTSPRKLRKAHGKTDHRTSRATPAVNVFSQPHLFDCLTSPRCILYARLPVNAHLPTFRFYCTYATPFRFSDTSTSHSIALRPRPRAAASKPVAFSLANVCPETRYSIFRRVSPSEDRIACS